MTSSVYTLLIVESPIIARIIQKLSPSSVYVLATEGYCWKPRYDPTHNRLTAIADPTKLSIRNELKEQSQYANSIIVATDNDPSGDFIAWSIARFMKANTVKRGRIQSLSKNGIISMLGDVQEIETDRLEIRLKNRYLIKHIWHQHTQLPDYHLAGLISVFGKSFIYNHFLDENNQLYKSSKPIHSETDELIEIKSIENENHFPVYQPLSTYDLIGVMVNEGIAYNYFGAQSLLQQLFETIPDLTNHSLISYPRTDARAFYSETWEDFQIQYLKLVPSGRLKPTFLRDIAEPETPHESIRPLDFSTKPADVQGELKSDIGRLYERIYEITLKSITIPDNLQRSFHNELRPDIYFYPVNSADLSNSIHSLRPCITIDDLGYRLNQLGIIRPSEFGKSLDLWIDKEWIKVHQNVVTPGKKILQNLQKSDMLNKILTDLYKLGEISFLKPETIRSIITSY